MLLYYQNITVNSIGNLYKTSPLFLCNHTKCVKLSENSVKSIDFCTQWVYNVDTIKERETPERKEIKKMYETVKVVNGYKIERMKGTHGFYHVTFWKSEKGRSSKECTFRTIKAATAFCETL